jgi:hypothetical protein
MTPRKGQIREKRSKADGLRYLFKPNMGGQNPVEFDGINPGGNPRQALGRAQCP